MAITMEQLYMRNYFVLIDQSGSMGEPVKSGSSVRRWEAVREYALAIARKCEVYDKDGMDVYTFNKGFKHYPNVTADKVQNVFDNESPMGGTDFVPVLTDVLNKHFAGNKPSTIIVITDGEPSDGAQGQKALAKLIVDTTKKLEGDDELGLSFIQVGDDKKARDFLKKLDDELTSAGAKFDIVDTKTCDELENCSIEDVLLGAVND